MSWMFAVGCGNGNGDDDDDATDAGGKDGTAPTLDATAPGDDDATTPADAAPDTGIIGSQDSGVKDAAADSTVPPGSDAGDAGEDAGDAGHDAGEDAGDAAVDAGTLPTFRTMGRWSTSGGTMSAAWPGSGILVSFTGPTLELNVSDTIYTGDGQTTGPATSGDYLAVYINGTKAAANVAINANGATIITSTAPATGTNTAEIYKVTDSAVGTIKITNYTTSAAGTHAGTPFTTTTAGTIVPAASTFVHKIEFIGDDQTAGWGDSASCTGSPTTNLINSNQNDISLAYPNLVARSFNAEYIATAAFQMGVDNNQFYDTSRTAAQMWPRILPDTDTTPTWTFSNYTPDAVVVNLGAWTDFGAPPIVDATFETDLAAFLGTVFTTYNKTPYILLVIGPGYSLGGAETETEVQTDTEAALTKFKAANTTAVADYVIATDYAAANSQGCNYLPSSVEYATIATQVEAKIKAALKW